MNDNSKYSFKQFYDSIPEKSPLKDKNYLNSCLLLSFIQAIYYIADQKIVPSPQFLLSMNDQTSHPKVEELFGRARVLRKEEIEVGTIDILIAALLLDMPLLFEGETGIGKTYTSQIFLKTIFPSQSYSTYRLSGNVFTNNVFQPFLKAIAKKDEFPRMVIDKQAIGHIGALFIDEINRGDPQSLLQLLDGKIYVSGEEGALGIAIPEVQKQKNNSNNNVMRKGVMVIGAQNPPAEIDSKFKGTSLLDAAVENRFLKIDFMGDISSVGSTAWFTENELDLHQSFIKQMIHFFKQFSITRETETKNGVPNNSTQSLEKLIHEDWLSLYAWMSDAKNHQFPILKSAQEFLDIAIMILNKEMEQIYKSEKQLIDQLLEMIGKKGLFSGLKSELISKETKEFSEFKSFVSHFETPFIFRDTKNIRKLANMMVMIFSAKTALRRMPDKNQDCVDSFNKYIQNPVSIKEIFWCMALLLKNKIGRQRLDNDSMQQINKILLETLNHYFLLSKKVCSQLAKDLNKSFVFDIQSYSMSIRWYILKYAEQKSSSQPMESQLDIFCETIIDCLNKNLVKDIENKNFITNMLIINIIADLLTLVLFVKENKFSITETIQKTKRPLLDDENSKGVINSTFKNTRHMMGLVVPCIYLQRLPRILGDQ